MIDSEMSLFHLELVSVFEIYQREVVISAKTLLGERSDKGQVDSTAKRGILLES
jgi:hypothetical protein